MSGLLNLDKGISYSNIFYFKSTHILSKKVKYFNVFCLPKKHMIVLLENDITYNSFYQKNQRVTSLSYQSYLSKVGHLGPWHRGLCVVVAPTFLCLLILVSGHNTK